MLGCVLSISSLQQCYNIGPFVICILLRTVRSSKVPIVDSWWAVGQIFKISQSDSKAHSFPTTPYCFSFIHSRDLSNTICYGQITGDIAMQAKDKVPALMDLVGAEREKES